MNILTSGTIRAQTSGFTIPASMGATGSDFLLLGETDGMASDFTKSDGTGYVSVKDTGTPANNLSNVIGDAFWTNSGTSPKLVRNSSGTLQWSPHNIATNSQDFPGGWSNNGSTDSANTTTAPDGTVTADTIVEDSSASGRHMMFQTVAAATVGINTVSVYVKRKDRQWASISINDNASVRYIITVDLDTGNVTQTDTEGGPTQTAYSVTAQGSGWYRAQVSMYCTADTSYAQIGLSDSATPTVSLGNASYAGDGSSGMYVWGGQFNKGPTATAYHVTTSAAWIGLGIDYDGTNYGLLTEPAATNLLLRSQQFNTPAIWSIGAGGSAIDAALVAPDGTLTGSEITEVVGSHTVYQIITVSASTAYTFSWYAKRGTMTDVKYSVYDLTNSGDIVASTSYYSSINSSTWTRVSVTFTTPVGCVSAAVYILRDSGATGTTNVWGAQMELGTVATSPIPSFASTVTRAKDNVSQLLTSMPFSNTEGAVYVKYTPIAVSLALDQPWVMVFNPTQLIEVYGLGPNFFVYDATVTQCDINLTGSLSYATSGQVSAAWKANDFAGSLNGAAVNTDTSGTVPDLSNPTNVLAIGRDETAGCCNMRIYKLVYVPRRVTDGDLPTWRYTP